MATLTYNEIRERKCIVFNGEPYEVVSSHVFRKQQRKPVNATKLRHLVTGKVIENSFAASDKAEEADLGSRSVIYIYSNKGEHWFHEKDDKSKRFTLESGLVADKLNFIKPGDKVDLLTFGERVTGLRLPIKVELKVKEAAPAIKGNTAQGGSKKVVLETGYEVQVPMFVNENDILLINTETGEYVERTNKK
ncbi:MAG: hypothetical protein U9M92_01940 [Patescibacteria group bacterium]|nr:hypothetical protein [Patescibacteria group bacterium]